MTLYSPRTKKIAHHIVGASLFIPRGLILPFLGWVDHQRAALNHDQLACHFCHRKIPPPRQTKHKIKAKVARLLNRIDRLLFLKNAAYIQRAFDFFMKIIPISLQKGISGLFNAPFIVLSVKRAFDFLKSNRDAIIWRGLIPFFVVAGCTAWWGLGVIPEIYIFSTVFFYWAKKMYDPISNLIIRRQDSKEWEFLKNLLIFCRRGKCTSEFYLQCKDIGNVFKRFLFELALLSSIGRLSKSIAYLFQDFFYWLGGYCVLKLVADQTPLKLHNFEKRIKKASLKNENYFYENTLWLITYNGLQSVGSDTAKEKYRNLHQNAHIYSKRDLKARIRP